MTIQNVLASLANGYVGNNMDETYRRKIGQLFEGALVGTLILVAIVALYGASLHDLRLLALLSFTISYCIKSIRWFCTEEGRKVTDSRFGTDREHEIPSIVRNSYPLFLTVVVMGIAAALLVPAFVWGNFGLLVSTFLTVGSPAVIWWRFGGRKV